MDGQKIKLYIDGRLWFEEMLILGVEEMRNNMFTIGGGLWEDEPTFNGLVDDMAIYDFAMTADQIAMLHAGVDPLAEGATLPAETRPSLPTEPAATTPATEPSEPEKEGDGRPVRPAGLDGGPDRRAAGGFYRAVGFAEHLSAAPAACFGEKGLSRRKDKGGGGRSPGGGE